MKFSYKVLIFKRIFRLIFFADTLPSLSYSFIDQTLQPGPLVSLKCSASGNPTPRITWTLDGYALPSNDRYSFGNLYTSFLFYFVWYYTSLILLDLWLDNTWPSMEMSSLTLTSVNPRLRMVAFMVVRPQTGQRTLKVDRLKVRSIFLSSQTWQKQLVVSPGCIGECESSGKTCQKNFLSCQTNGLKV